MEIRKYTEADEAALFDMMRGEGEDWSCYYGAAEKYRQALASSHVFVAVEGGALCGYARARDDDGLGVYIYDLLVGRQYRGRSIGAKLMEAVCADFPQETIYVMSGVDGYYEKQDCRRVGSVFEVRAERDPG